jgi:hypothetical protein
VSRWAVFDLNAGPPFALAEQDDAELVPDVLHEVINAQAGVHRRRHAEEHDRGDDVRKRGRFVCPDLVVAA